MEPIIKPTGQKSWENRHFTFKEDIDNLYDVWNAEDPNLLGVYNATTKGIQDLLAQAIADGKDLRSLGGGWSFTRIATAHDARMVNTKNMHALFNITTGVSASYTGTADKLLFAQCGNSMLQLNKYLKGKGRSLKTTGASNGQTVVGALSTGTHGSAFDFGSIPEYVVALHIIVSPTRHIWLERSSAPVMADDFPTTKFGAELLRDDELFNAALVSFGNFGFIHGVMLETEEIFLLECHRQTLPVDDKLLELMRTLDFNAYAGLPHGHERPFHFQTLINPYDKDQNAYVTTMYKRPYRTDYTPPAIDRSGIGPGDDAPAFLGVLSESVAAMVPLLVNKLIASTYKPYTNVFGTIGEIFTNVDTRGKVLSAAIGVALSDTRKVLDVLNQVNQTDGPFSGVFAFRYVKGTAATLGFTRFSPVTCVVELDGVMSNHSYDFYKKVWDELEAQHIPFTFHWGKICTITPARLDYMYGPKVAQWKTARETLLPDPAVRKVFTNEQMVEWGLG